MLTYTHKKAVIRIKRGKGWRNGSIGRAASVSTFSDPSSNHTRSTRMKRGKGWLGGSIGRSSVLLNIQ